MEYHHWLILANGVPPLVAVVPNLVLVVISGEIAEEIFPVWAAGGVSRLPTFQLDHLIIGRPSVNLVVAGVPPDPGVVGVGVRWQLVLDTFRQLPVKRSC